MDVVDNRGVTVVVGSSGGLDVLDNGDILIVKGLVCCLL